METLTLEQAHKIAEELEKELSPKHVAFAKEYINKGMNATQAHLEVYKGTYNTARKSGSDLLAKPDIKKLIRMYSFCARRETAITKERQLQKLDDIIEKAMEAEPVLDPDGEPTGEYKAQLREAIAALKEQSKLLGIYEADKIDITTKGERIKTNTVGEFEEFIKYKNRQKENE